MSKKLDKNRPFSDIYGSDVIGRFEQDGVVFDGLGNEITGPVDQTVEARAEAGGLEDALTKIEIESGITPADVKRNFVKLEDEMNDMAFKLRIESEAKAELQAELTEAKARIGELEVELIKAGLELEVREGAAGPDVPRDPAGPRLKMKDAEEDAPPLTVTDGPGPPLAAAEEYESPLPAGERAGPPKSPSLEVADLDFSGSITKGEIIIALEKFGIEHDKNATKVELLALAKSVAEANAPPADKAGSAAV